MSKPEPKRPRPDLHKVWSGEEADKECKTIGGHKGINCEHCDKRYIVHCDKCMIQLTNCSCTVEALQRRIDQENKELEENSNRVMNGYLDIKIAFDNINIDF